MNREEHAIHITVDDSGLWCTWHASKRTITYMFLGKTNEDYYEFIKRITTLADTGVDICSDEK
jgi:hypothetical protein